MLNDFIPHVTAVDEGVLRFTIRQNGGGYHGPAANLQQVVAQIYCATSLQKSIAQHLPEPAFGIISWPVMAFFTVAADREADFRMSQCLTANRFKTMSVFGGRTFKEFAAGGCIEIQVTHFYDRTGGQGVWC